MEFARLYALLPRGRQLHSMCSHARAEAEEDFLRQLNESQQVTAHGVPMKLAYLYTLSKNVRDMVESLTDNFDPRSMSVAEIEKFVVGIAIL